ncbi:MAG: aminotransferase class V-fold PLP-dependent enzyme [Pseudomonadota bacterium]
MTQISSPNEQWDWHEDHGFSPVINVSGTMTGLGASVTSSGVRDATAQAMSRFVKMHELQAHASEVIARLTGAEAGCMSASASAGISLAIAGCMTGLDPAKAEALPGVTGRKCEVVVQAGHLCGYGAPIETAIALAGATTRSIGQSTLVMDHQLEGALGEDTAAALYVVSHHVVHYGQIPFDRFAAICKARGVPVIVDAASEYDLRGFIEAGADIAIYSAHKFMGGPTGGIIAGRRHAVRAAYLQNISIGRGMKIGKESIAGAIAAMEEWMQRDHAAMRAREDEVLEFWHGRLSQLPGIRPVIVPDPTGNPLQRLQIEVDTDAAGATAATFARVLGEQSPAIIVRDHEVELGYFQLDPCNLLAGQEELVANTVHDVLRRGHDFAEEPDDLARARNGGVEGYLSWLNDT